MNAPALHIFVIFVHILYMIHWKIICTDRKKDKKINCKKPVLCKLARSFRCTCTSAWGPSPNQSRGFIICNVKGSYSCLGLGLGTIPNEVPALQPVEFWTKHLTKLHDRKPDPIDLVEVQSKVWNLWRYDNEIYSLFSHLDRTCQVINCA